MNYFFKYPEIYEKWKKIHGATKDQFIIESDDPDLSLATEVMNNCKSFAWLCTLASLKKPFPELPIRSWQTFIDYGVLIEKEDGFVVHPLFKLAIPMRLVSSDVPASWGAWEMSLRAVTLSMPSWTSLGESSVPPSSLRLVWIPPEQRLGFQDQGYGIPLHTIVPKGCVLLSR